MSCSHCVAIAVGNNGIESEDDIESDVATTHKCVNMTAFIKNSYSCYEKLSSGSSGVAKDRPRDLLGELGPA